MAPPLTRVGGTTDAGTPTVSSVAGGTVKAARTLGDNGEVPTDPVAAAEPPALGCEDAAGLEFSPTLMTIIVTMTAMTSPTGMSAAATG
jgi:hypothetical protein